MAPFTADPKSGFPGPLTYDTSAQLMNDMSFRGRVKVACLHFATYIQGEAVTTPAHNTRYTWAQGCLQNPDVSVNRFTPAVVMDPAVQGAGDTITDAALQTATEDAIQAQL
jgi:hypothetical protein